MVISDGQRQKLLLARTLLNNDNEFLILDEAFSYLDKKERERFVKLFLNTVNKTTIIVSHQKDILQQVDSIIYIQDGNVIQGTYSYLIGNSKEFKEYLLNK